MKLLTNYFKILYFKQPGDPFIPASGNLYKSILYGYFVIGKTSNRNWQVKGLWSRVRE